MKYRKTSLIEAFQMTVERRWDNKDWPEWMNRAWNNPPGVGGIWIDPDDTNRALLIVGTLENPMRVSWDDWIARGEGGELWPIKPDIFAKTYEAAE